MFSPKEFRRSTLNRRRASSRRRGPSLGMEQLENRLALSAVTIVIRHGQDNKDSDPNPQYGTRQAGWNTSLKTAINSALTKLTADINSTQTTINVASATGFPTTTPFGIKIDDERMMVIGGAGTTTWTVTRKTDGTTAASHKLNAGVAGARTQLMAAIDSTQTTINVASAEGFPITSPFTPFKIQIDEEIMNVTGSTAGPKKTATWTVTRGTDVTPPRLTSNRLP